MNSKKSLNYLTKMKWGKTMSTVWNTFQTVLGILCVFSYEHSYALKRTDNTEQDNNSNYVERSDFLFISGFVILVFLWDARVAIEVGTLLPETPYCPRLPTKSDLCMHVYDTCTLVHMSTCAVRGRQDSILDIFFLYGPLNYCLYR